MSVLCMNNEGWQHQHLLCLRSIYVTNLFSTSLTEKEIEPHTKGYYLTCYLTLHYYCIRKPVYIYIYIYILWYFKTYIIVKFRIYRISRAVCKLAWTSKLIIKKTCFCFKILLNIN